MLVNPCASGTLHRYVSHCCNPHGTLIVRIFAHCEQEHDGVMNRYVIMGNMLPESRELDEIYDLKFCADDKAMQLQKKKINVILFPP